MTAQQPNPLKILSAKILKGKGDDPDDVRITYIEHFQDNSTAKIPGEFNRQPHPDFIQAFQKLVPHLAVLTDQIDIAQLTEEKLKSFKVHHFMVNDSKNRGFMIFGSKEGRYGRVGLETRLILFESKVMKEEYPLSEQLIEDLTNVASEAAKYVRGKHLPDPQGKLPFDEATNVQVAKPVIFPEQETDVSHLYGIEPKSILEQAEIDAKERLDRENVKPFNQEVREQGGYLPQADPEAMERVKDSPDVDGVISAIEKVIQKKTRKKVAQTPEARSGEIEE